MCDVSHDMQVGMGRDHTLFALSEGTVKFTRVARQPLPPQKGCKWTKKPWKKFVNVIAFPQSPRLILSTSVHPSY